MRNWIRRRQGADRGPVTLRRGRIYILPTNLGFAFGLMLFAMLLGSLNYANNLGLGLTFLLTSLALVTMQACHRNLETLVASEAGTEPSFAGQDAIFQVALANRGGAARCDLEASTATNAADPVSIPAGGEATVNLRVATRRRGWVALDRIEIATQFPYGLFRAWAVLHPDRRCLVYPRPADSAPPSPPVPGNADAGAMRRGDDDFAGLKDYHPGDPPRHIAWKAYAKGGELLVKEFSGAAQPVPIFDLAQAPGAELESRLSVMARWIVDAEARSETFGLRLPGLEIPPQPGRQQGRRCLAALAEYQAVDPAHA
ncbi:MAG: DUF58 domain-containing protein [Steroidobacteraceae bacterium]